MNYKSGAWGEKGAEAVRLNDEMFDQLVEMAREEEALNERAREQKEAEKPRSRPE